MQYLVPLLQDTYVELTDSTRILCISVQSFQAGHSDFPERDLIFWTCINGTQTAWGKLVFKLYTQRPRDALLTRYGDKELDCITVSMETELGLRHRTIWDKATSGLVIAVISTVDMDDTSRAVPLSRCWRGLVG